MRQTLDDSGNMTGVRGYDPYGQVEAGGTLAGAFGYTGELQDPATGAAYLRARWYRPGQAALLGVDPALDSTGQPYAYAGDNPANASDPSGLCTFPGGQLTGILGLGSCQAAVYGALTGTGSAVHQSVQQYSAAFTVGLDQELQAAQIALQGGQSFAGTLVLNQDHSYAPNFYSSNSFSAAGAAEHVDLAGLAPGGLLDRTPYANNQLTGLFLGSSGNGNARLAIAVMQTNGVVFLAISVLQPGAVAKLTARTLGTCTLLSTAGAIAVPVAQGAGRGMSTGGLVGAIAGALIAAALAINVASSQSVPVPYTRIGSKPHQTCSDEVLAQLEANKARMCGSIPGTTCSASKGNKKKLSQYPCSLIRQRIAGLKACIAAREQIQAECYAGNPEAGHEAQIDSLRQGLSACEALEKVNCAPGNPMCNK